MARWFCIVMLVLYALSSLYAALSHGYWMTLFGASLALTGAAGLFRRWAWSQYAIYLLAFSMFLEWVYVLWISRAVWATAQTSTGGFIIVFTPGVIMMALCAYICRTAFRLLHKKA